MKKHTLLYRVGKILLFILLIHSLNAEAQFRTTWITNDTQITIPTFFSETYLYDITWTNLTNTGVGDGSDTGITGNYTITGLTNGDTYQIDITGTFPRIFFNNGGDKTKILTIESWGTNAWTSMGSAFYGCTNLTVSATTPPDLTNVLDMSNMFRACSSFNSDINNWSVVGVENMSGLFRNATQFNQPLDTWNVSSVTDMSYMFAFTDNFNQDIGGWHTDNVNTMALMFAAAKSFNQNINYKALTGAWNTNTVTNMNQMFSLADNFNQPLDGWDVSNVTNFGSMFNGALAFNQPIGGWTIGAGPNINMGSMFKNTSSFNQDISNWTVANVTDMSSMFSGATAFNQYIGSWDVSSVTSMRFMFAYSTYNLALDLWDLSSVTDYNGMFENNTAFNQDISYWTINTISSVSMNAMFNGATSFNQNLGSWNMTGVNLAFSMLDNTGLTIENYDNLLIGWSVQSLKSNVNFGAVGLYYCTASAERNNIIANFNWTITDEGPGCIKVYEGADTNGPEIFNGQSAKVDFGSAEAGVGKTKSITIENRLASTISINSISINNTSGIAYTVSTPTFPADIPPASTQVVTIKFNQTVSGTYDDDFSILSDNLPGPYNFPVTGVITATAQPEIKVFEGSNPFGTEILDGDVTGYFIGQQDRGTSAVNQITIVNNGSAPLVVSNITFTGTAFSANLTSFTIPVDGSQTIDITLDGSIGGNFSETMNILSDDADESTFNFLVTGIINGPELVVVDGTDYYVDPLISNGQPTPLDLGTATIGSNIVKQISITNNGLIDLSVSNISITGTAFSHNAILPLTVGAVVDGVYSYATFDIILDGSVAGTFTETITITSDDDAAPSYTFDITGDISDPAAPKVYWTDNAEINRSNLDGSAFQQYHMESTFNPRGIAIDTQNKLAYWTNNWGQIKVGSIDATGFSSVTDFINDGIDLPRELNGIALDVTNGKIYWASTYDGTIKSADLADPDPLSTVQIIVSGLANPLGVAVDPSGKIYYTENDNNSGANDNTATLHQVNFDGSNDITLSTTLLAGEQYTYRDVKLDISTNMIYWSGANDDIYIPIGEIYYANISDVSGTVTSFATLNSSPRGIDLDVTNNKIYWTDELVYFVEPKIGYANLDGSNVQILQNGFNDGINNPLFIALDLDFSPPTICVNPPTSNAGLDQTVCGSTAVTLNASFGGSASSGLWSTSGDGSFDNAANLTAVYTPGLNDYNNGAVTLTFTTDDPDGTGPCLAATDNMIINYLNPTAVAGLDFSICSNDVANLSGTIGGGVTSLTWTTDGDGSFNDATLGTAIYTPGTNDIANGSVNLTITTNDPDGTGPCLAATDNLILTIETLPTVNAGIDQTICPSDLVALNGTITGSPTSFSWSSSGDGAFDNPGSLTATYTPGSNDLAGTSITLALTATSTTCVDVVDALVINIIQPINAVNQSGTIKVGESVIVDALNGATTNIGDVISVSISTNPQKGNVTVNTDGTITYTASQGTVGNDSFVFQICNQCNLCSSATANLTIVNDAPVINSTTGLAYPGKSTSIDLAALITDVNNNIDLSSIRIILQPISGAVATIDSNNILHVDYTGVIFFGTDELVIEVCDFDGACSTATIFIEVAAQPIVAFNAVSPNNDGRHDFLEFEYIEAYPNNEVKIFNRWGDIVYSIEGYNNDNIVFAGKANKGSSNDLPAGTYYYIVTYLGADGTDQTTKGFFELRR